MDPHTYCHDAYAPYNPAPRNSDLFGYINLALATFNIGLGNVFLRRFEIQKKQIEEHQKQIDDLTTALNESREQIQALLDFCFTDRSKWKEGASIFSSAEDRCTPDVRREGASRSISDGTGCTPNVGKEGASRSISDEIGYTPNITKVTPDQILQRSLDELIVSLDMKDPSIN